MENKHTAGQWEVKDCHDDTRTAEIKSDGKNIATVWAYNGGSKVIDFNEQQANAKLIAASPILYNAAYSALQAIYAMPKKKQAFYKYLINDLLNAIQKANGTII